MENLVEWKGYHARIVSIAAEVVPATAHRQSLIYLTVGGVRFVCCRGYKSARAAKRACEEIAAEIERPAQ